MSKKGTGVVGRQRAEQQRIATAITAAINTAAQAAFDRSRLNDRNATKAAWGNQGFARPADKSVDKALFAKDSGFNVQRTNDKAANMKTARQAREGGLYRRQHVAKDITTHIITPEGERKAVRCRRVGGQPGITTWRPTTQQRPSDEVKQQRAMYRLHRKRTECVTVKLPGINNA